MGLFFLLLFSFLCLIFDCHFHFVFLVYFRRLTLFRMGSVVVSLCGRQVCCCLSLLTSVFAVVCALNNVPSCFVMVL